MKILQFGDIHAEDGPKFSEIEKCLIFIAEQAEIENPDIIINTGDTFNSREVKLDSQSAKLVFNAFSRLADVAPVVVIIGTPSHDGNAVEVLKHVRGRFPVEVATTPRQIEIAGAIVSAIPAPTKQFMQGDTIEGGDAHISAAMSAMFAGFGAQAPDNQAHILVGHWNTVGSKIHGQDYIGQEISIGVDQMLLAQPDLICLGHIHDAQQICDRLFYNGSIYQKDYGEMSDKGFWLHELNKTIYGLQSRFIKTPSRKLYRIQVDCTDGISACLWVPAGHEKSEVEGAHVRYEVTCWQDEAQTVPVKEIEKAIMAAGAESVDVRLVRVPRQTVRADIVLKAITLREKLVAMAELRGEVVPESILLKSDAIAAYSPDEMLQVVAGGVGSRPVQEAA